MKHLTNTDYAQMVKTASLPTNSIKNVSLAFIVGGLICALGEGFIHLYRWLGMDTDHAFSVASITLIFLAALLTGLNIYDDIAKHGGAGTLVPITGFSNAVTAPALEFKSEGFILGLGTKMFSIAGPVLVYGLAGGVIYGLILYLFQLY